MTGPKAVAYLSFFVILTITFANPALAAPPTGWHVNGNGYVGILTYTADPVTGRVSGTLLGTPCEGFLVGRRLILHRYPQGQSQLWEGWIMDPGLGAQGRLSYRGQYFIAGSISENKAGNSFYPWYGVPLNSGPPPWNTGGGGGVQPGGGGGGIQPGGGGGIQPGGGGQAGGGLVFNPSFELGRPTGSFLTLGTGSRDLDGWQITQGSIDVIQGYWRSSHGNRSIDLNGSPGVGGLSQVITTAPGQTYVVSFDLAGNPVCGDSRKKLLVRAAGQSARYTFNTRGRTRTNMGWIRRTFTFTARSTSTTLEFISLSKSNASCGPALDNISATASSGGSAGGLLPGGGLNDSQVTSGSLSGLWRMTCNSNGTPRFRLLIGQENGFVTGTMTRTNGSEPVTRISGRLLTGGRFRFTRQSPDWRQDYTGRVVSSAGGKALALEGRFDHNGRGSWTWYAER